MEEGGIIHKIYYMVGGGCGPNFKPFTELISSFKNRKIIKGLANNLYGRLAMKDYFHQYTLLDEEEFLLKGGCGLLGR